MNQNNLDFLKERLFFLGFGENLHAQLEENIKKQPEKFNLSFTGEFENKGKKEIVDYTLDFSKSKQNDMYFANNYTATLRNEEPEKEKTHKFYLNNGSGVAAKEAYNMLQGRAVYKDKLTNRNDEKYSAWLQLNFKEADDKGNYKVQQYHKAWGFNLDRNLNKYPIKELENTALKEQVVKDLEKGHIRQVTFVQDEKEVKMFLEANPKDRNLIVYDENMKKQFQGIRQHNTPVDGQGVEGRGADVNQPVLTVEGSAKKNGPEEKGKEEHNQNKGPENKLSENSKLEKKSLQMDPPIENRSKKRGMKV